jgi:hypothetical protein
LGVRVPSDPFTLKEVTVLALLVVTLYVLGARIFRLACVFAYKQDPAAMSRFNGVTIPLGTVLWPFMAIILIVQDLTS